MSKSILYAANTSAQTTLATGTVVNFGSIVRRYGCNCNLSGGNVVVRGSGYYDIETNFTITPTSAGTVFVSIYKDGVEVPGATASFDVASGVAYVVTVPAVIRETCGCDDTITVEISGEPASVTNATIIVEKL